MSQITMCLSCGDLFVGEGKIPFCTTTCKDAYDELKEIAYEEFFRKYKLKEGYSKEDFKRECELASERYMNQLIFGVPMTYEEMRGWKIQKC